MFSTTFLGHQGWAFAAGETRVLVDPLLSTHFGHGGGVGVVYPPRRFDFTRFPAIDAVLITHEHEDHFDVPSLTRLDRRIPILLSAMSSAAARTLLDEMGFQVRLVRGGDSVTVGELTIDLFPPDHLRAPEGDEWDVLQFVVRDRNGDGSFTSGVDCPMPMATVAKIKALIGRRGLWSYANNVTHWPFQHGGAVIETPPPTALTLADDIARQEAAVRERWSSPAGVLICGGGWSFIDDRQWLNHNVFPCDSHQAAEALATRLSGGPVLAPRPGQTIHMAGGEIAEVAPSAPFLSAADLGAWPSRSYAGDVALMGDYAPACGRHDLAPGDLAGLIEDLADLGRHLYGGPLFRALCSLDAAALGPRRPAFALVLLTGPDRAAYVLEYDPSACAFALADTVDPIEDYVAGMECWGSDLLAAVRGDLAPTAIVFGRNRSWSHQPRALSINGADLFWSFFHPLRRPARFLDLYRRLLAEPAADPTCVAAASPTELRVQRRAAAAS